MNIHSTGTTSTGATRETFSTSIESLKAAIEALKVPEHPILTWMRQQDKPPEEWSLVLPSYLSSKFNTGIPDGVSFSELLTGNDAIFVKRKEVNLYLNKRFKSISDY